jgi:hypothetical protein
VHIWKLLLVGLVTGASSEIIASAAFRPRLPLLFEESFGHASRDAQWIARGPDYEVLLTSTEATFSVKGAAGRTPETITLQFGSRDSASASEGLDATGGTSNYFRGNDPSKWRMGVPHFRRIRFRDTYPGIDTVFYGNPGDFEFDFVAKPRADVSRIRLSWKRTTSAEVTADGAILLKAQNGSEVRVNRPDAYQEIGGVRRLVQADFVLDNATHTARMRIGSYDRNRELVIDPIIRYATYYGSAATEYGTGIAVDTAGNAYVVGATTTAPPTTPGAYRRVLPPGAPIPAFCGGLASPGMELAASDDIFVAKFNPSGTALVYAAWIGGSGCDWPGRIAIDSEGNAYITGITPSADFPYSSGTYMSPPPGDVNNGSAAFALKLNAAGSAIVYSVRLGHGAGYTIKVDATGAAYIGGQAYGPAYPTTAGAADTTYSHLNAFVTKLNPSGTALVYSTYLNATGTYGLAVDTGGNAYVAGHTYGDLPVTPGATDTTYGGTGGDAFLAKLNTTGSAFLYSTYIGGSEWDRAAAVVIDSIGNAYVTGTTSSTDFPTTAEAYRRYFGIGEDAMRVAPFVVKVDASGAFQYATLITGYLQGNYMRGEANDIAVDSEGHAHLAIRLIRNFSSQPNVFQLASVPGAVRLHSSGRYLMGLSSSTLALYNSSRVGSARGIATDATGQTYVTGGVGPDIILASEGAYDSTYSFGIDAFVESTLLLPFEIPTQAYVSPDGGAVAVDGQVIESEKSFFWMTGSSHVLEARDTNSSSRRSRFLMWEHGGPAAQTIYHTSTIPVFRARFEVSYKVSATALPATGGVVASSPIAADGFAVSGSTLVFTPIAAVGYKFVTFSGDGDGTTTRSVLVNGPKSVVAQFAPCLFTVSKQVIAARFGEPATFSIGADAECAWSITGLPNWLTILPSSGTGPRTVAVSVTANTSGARRTAILSIGDTTVQVTQDVACVASLSWSNMTVPVQSSAGSISINAGPGCAWTAASNVPWLQVYPLAGTGPSLLELTIYPNYTTKQRTAVISVDGSNALVTQPANSDSLSNRFVTQMYFAYFGRDPSPQEVTVHVNSGVSRAQLVIGFMNSEEFQLAGRFVAGLYVGILDRDAEYPGWLFQRNAIVKGITNPNILVGSFMNSAEYKLKFGNPSDDEFVRLLYRHILLRDASPNEVALQVGALKSVSRVQLATAFLNTPEFRQGAGPRLSAFLLFGTLLQRNPTGAEGLQYVNALASGVSLSTAVEQILSSTEFNQRLD